MMFQLIDKEDGVRSPVFTATREELADGIKENIPETEWDSAYILVVMDDLKADWNFSQLPILTINDFIHFTRACEHE